MKTLAKNQKNWGIQDKVKARYESVFEPYQKLFKRKSLFVDKEYWSLCGQCTDQYDTLLDNCEIDHALKLKFIKPHQFHGVEFDEEIAESNAKLDIGNWYKGDISDKLCENANNVGLLNLDMIGMIKTQCAFFVKCLYYVKKYSNIMVVGNFVIRSRARIDNIQLIYDILYKSDIIQDMIENGWELYPGVYEYNGTGGRTGMGTVILYRK